jgi:Helix-turn-helix domain
MERVFTSSKARGSARLVLLAIAWHAHDDGTQAYPKVRTLAAEANLKERQVQNILRRLEASGELVVERRPHRTHLMTVVVKGAEDCTLDASRDAETPDTRGADDYTLSVQSVAPDGAAARTLSVQPIAPEPYLSVPVTLKGTVPSEDAALRAVDGTNDEGDAGDDDSRPPGNLASHPVGGRSGEHAGDDLARIKAERGNRYRAALRRKYPKRSDSEIDALAAGAA